MLIEAARLAKNIAPGRDREFAFQAFPNYPGELFQQLHDEARSKEMNKSRTII
jgi:23S rRNA G2445 N2-methylase RlmL